MDLVQEQTWEGLQLGMTPICKNTDHLWKHRGLVPHLTHVCSLCTSHRSFSVPCGTACPSMSWYQTFSPKELFFNGDIKSKDAKKTQCSFVWEKVFFGSGWAKEIPLPLSSLPSYLDLHNLMNGIISVKSDKSQESDTQHLEHTVLLCPLSLT